MIFDPDRQKEVDTIIKKGHSVENASKNKISLDSFDTRSIYGLERPSDNTARSFPIEQLQGNPVNIEGLDYASVPASLIPSVDNLYYLGSALKSWKGVYAYNYYDQSGNPIYTFRTIVPTAGDNVVGDSKTDTLTMTCSNGVLSITGTAATDTLDFDVVANGIDDTHINWGTGAGQVSGVDMPIADAGNYYTGTEVETALQEVGVKFERTVNRGVSDTITVTLTGGLGISWTTGELYDKSTGVFLATTAGSGNVTNNSTNYLKWVSGSGLTISTTGTSGDEILVSTFAVQDGTIEGYLETTLLDSTMADTRRGLRALFPTRVVSGMSVSEDTNVDNALDVVMDAGVAYKDAIQKVTPVEIKTRNTAMVRHFHTSGAWDSDTNAEVDTINYDNGTNKTAIPNNKWVKSFFFYSNLKLGWVYPTTYYNTKAEALVATLPVMPPGVEVSPKLTAIVYQQGDADFTKTTWQDIRSGVGENSFNAVSDHGALSGLSDDDHTQYLLADGTRALAGAWDMGSQALTNVNIDSGNINVAVVQTDWDTAHTHSQGDGSDHADVATNTIHRGLTSGNPHNVTLADVGGTTDHTALSNIGSNTHAQIDTFIASKGNASGLAELDVGGKVPSAQLPAYVDDVLEYANLAAFPATGETGKIYIALDTNLTYRWSGSVYVEISVSLALGETSSTAYRGDRGASAYSHISASGASHSYIDQSVISGASPTFDGTNFTGIPDGALDTDYVEVAGDTMTGALNMTANILPTTDSAYNLGSSTKYWDNLYTDKIFLNATATIDGTAAGVLDVTGRMDISEIRASSASGLKLYEDGGKGIFVKDGGFVGIGTTSPTHKLDILGDGTTDIVLRIGYDDPEGTRLDLITGASTVQFNAYNDGTATYVPIHFRGYPVILYNRTVEVLRIDINDRVGIGTASPTAKLDVNSTIFRLRTENAISKSGDNGNIGDICWGRDYLYVCVSSNTWKRASLSTW